MVQLSGFSPTPVSQVVAVCQSVGECRIPHTHRPARGNDSGDQRRSYVYADEIRWRECNLNQRRTRDFGNRVYTIPMEDPKGLNPEPFERPVAPPRWRRSLTA